MVVFEPDAGSAGVPADASAGVCVASACTLGCRVTVEAVLCGGVYLTAGVGGTVSPHAGVLADARGVPGVRSPRGVSLRFVGVLDLAVRVRPKRRG